MRGLRDILHNKRMRHIAYGIIAGILVLWVIYRFIAISIQNNMVVYNATRAANEHGVPVYVMTAQTASGTLREPIMIRNNRGYVSAARVGKFAAGQKIGAGKITSVASRIDLDSGMYIVRTRDVSDGLQFAEYVSQGIFVPVYALENDTVMVMRNGVAYATSVDVARQDADYALIKSGLNNGDVVILSNVADGVKVKVQQQ